MFENSSQNYEGAAAVANNPQRTQAREGQEDPSNAIKGVSGPHGQRSHVVTKPPPGSRLESTLQKIQNFRVEFAPSKKDILNFTNQLAVMVRAGISLQDSLESIAEQSRNQKFKVVITDLKNQIEAGQSFSQALAEHPQVFSNLYINMVAAAEVSGSLSLMLQKLAEYLDQEA